jgi:hypothetical protein
MICLNLSVRPRRHSAPRSLTSGRSLWPTQEWLRHSCSPQRARIGSLFCGAERRPSLAHGRADCAQTITGSTHRLRRPPIPALTVSPWPQLAGASFEYSVKKRNERGSVVKSRRRSYPANRLTGSVDDLRSSRPKRPASGRSFAAPAFPPGSPANRLAGFPVSLTTYQISSSAGSAPLP